MLLFEPCECSLGHTASNCDAIYVRGGNSRITHGLLTGIFGLYWVSLVPGGVSHGQLTDNSRWHMCDLPTPVLSRTWKTWLNLLHIGPEAVKLASWPVRTHGCLRERVYVLTNDYSGGNLSLNKTRMNVRPRPQVVSPLEFASHQAPVRL